MDQPLFCDSHCHIDFDDFDNDRDEVLKSAKQQGVVDVIVPSVAASSWQKTIDVCLNYRQCHLALGLHPMFIDQHQPDHLLHLDQLIEQQQPIAVGEIGLDFYDHAVKSAELKEKQLIYFDKQLIIAEKHQLPVIIHNRKAHDDCLSLIKNYSIPGGIVHAFNGSIQQAEKYIEQGFLLGFGGMLTHPHSRKLRHLALTIPVDSMIIETDAPDMTVSQHRGERNSPEYLLYVADSLAQLKGLSVECLASQLQTNLTRVFTQLDAWGFE